ncbi:hypothetical protein BCR44DRAFT_305561 [Catenaria anguillulae PL171]|uniref:G-protein coupled receptors family 1 profile domain-containing protein n=1 Tax=Catenaria anguillulae PL171 TaxID=765915 RepID=A0A1Y2I3K2_9FUNG|nr:hypothetical protein BCR44DRAFT_305561 [Catenaria anguillulae PL171]
MFLGVLAFEQGVTILYLRRFHAEHANWVTATIYIVSGLWTTFQLLPPWRPMYSAGGDFCYSTAWADWPALINLTLALGMIVTLAVAYAVIIARLSWTLGRGNHRRQRAQDTGPTKTFLNRDDYDVTYDQQQQPSAGHSSDGKLLASVSNSRNRSQDGRPKLTGPHKKSAEKSREAKIQRQFIIRGALSVMTACVLFGVMWVACFTVYTQKKQVDVFYGTATTSCLFIGMVLDPIVATVQEPRLRRAFKEVMFARGSKLHKPSSSSMSLGTPTDSQSVSSSQRIQNNHLMSVM